MRRYAILVTLVGALLYASPALAFHLQRRASITVRQFAAQRAERFLSTYLGESIGQRPALSATTCQKGATEMWHCQVGRRPFCVVKLGILDEGPSGPPLYVVSLSARCPE
jgi:hypothetical protein